MKNDEMTNTDSCFEKNMTPYFEIDNAVFYNNCDGYNCNKSHLEKLKKSHMKLS